MKFRYKVFLIGDPCCWLTGPGIVLLEIHFLVDCAILQVVRNKSEDLTPQAQTVSSQLYNSVCRQAGSAEHFFQKQKRISSLKASGN